MDSTTSLLEQLIACGTPAHLVAAVGQLEIRIAVLEAGAAALEAKRAYDRERKRLSRSQDVTGSHVTSQDSGNSSTISTRARVGAAVRKKEAWQQERKEQEERKEDKEEVPSDGAQAPSYGLPPPSADVGEPSVFPTGNGGGNVPSMAAGVHCLPSSVDRNGEPYAFEAGIIRLNRRNFDLWTEAYPHLSLKAELLRLSKWAGELGPRKWFHAVSAQLANREHDAVLVIEKIKAEAGKPHPIRHTKDDPYAGIT